MDAAAGGVRGRRLHKRHRDGTSSSAVPQFGVGGVTIAVRTPTPCDVSIAAENDFVELVICDAFVRWCYLGLQRKRDDHNPGRQGTPYEQPKSQRFY